LLYNNGQNILSFDIELPQGYNEKVRKGGGYNPDIIGANSLDLFKIETSQTPNNFFSLLRTYFIGRDN
jgi:hypothetical protein